MFIYRRRARAPLPQDIAEREPPVQPKSMANITRVITWVSSALGLQTDRLPHKMYTDGIVPVLEQSRPVMRVITWPEPAINVNNVQYTVPPNVLWEMIALRFLFQAGAAAANRNVWMRFVGPGNVGLFWAAGANYVHVANEDTEYSVGPAGVFGATVPSAAQDTILVPTPNNMWLLPDSRIEISFQNFQAGDNINAPYMLVRELQV